MEILVKICWFLIGAIHFIPSLVLFFPGMVERLYSVDPEGEIGVLLVHRAALFVTVFLASIYAVFQPSVRKLAAIVAAISMLSFLFVYFRAGMPVGSLRTIAVVDLVGIIPLALVAYSAFSSRT